MTKSTTGMPGDLASKLFLRLRSGLCLKICAVFTLACISARGDQIEMQNGDRYAGTVLALNTNGVVIQSEVLGLINLPREKVATISLGVAAATNRVQTAGAISGKPRTAQPILITNSPAPSALSKQIPADTNVIKQVEEQFLAGASPEARAKFNQLASGLMNGSVSVGDIRKEARAAADQLRAAKRDLGPEASEAFDGYLAILDSFLRDSEAEAAPVTKAAAPSGAAKTPGGTQ